MDKPTVYRSTRFNVDDFPRTAISRAYIEIVADGLACDVLVPLLVARGHHPGPVFGLTAAVHGNELNGIRVIHDIFERLDVSVLHGTLVGVVALNVPGLHAHEREIYRQFDLNREFPGHVNGNVAQVYAYRLLDRIIERFDYLIDLHTASFGRLNSLYVRADLENDFTRRMALLQRPQIILHSRASDHTLRGAAMERGIPAITVEVGDPQRFQASYAKQTRTGILDVLADAKMLPKRPRREGRAPILCSSSRWIYCDRGGLLEVLPEIAARVEEGEAIARQRNAFGDLIRSYFAPHAGVVIGKSSNPIGPTGSRVLHLGLEIPDGHSLHGPLNEASSSLSDLEPDLG